MFTQSYNIMNAAFAQAEKVYHTPSEDKPSGLKCCFCQEDIMQGDYCYKIGDAHYCEYCVIRTQAVEEW